MQILLEVPKWKYITCFPFCRVAISNMVCSACCLQQVTSDQGWLSGCAQPEEGKLAGAYTQGKVL